ncbi:MAG: hypothetical protein ACI31E_01395 [Muribaculaceae bacterium]
MNISPIARRVKIRITSGGSSHSDLDSLLRRFCLTDLEPLIADGRLSRWLVQIGESDKAKEIESFAENKFADAESIVNILHIFFDFTTPVELAKHWMQAQLYDNIAGLYQLPLLRADIELALYLAGQDFKTQEIAHADFWMQVFQSLKPDDAQSMLSMYPFFSRLGMNVKLKSLMRQFSDDENVKNALSKSVNETILKELRFWITNIRLIREHRPAVRLDTAASSEHLNGLLYHISKLNRSYYSKDKEEQSLRYRPQMIVGKDIVTDILNSHVAASYMLVFRVLASLCRMQYFNKEGALNIGTVPGLDLLSNQRIEYSVTADPKIKEIRSVADFCNATFANQIIYIVTETLIKRQEYYFDCATDSDDLVSEEHDELANPSSSPADPLDVSFSKDR